jgi:short-subunit dehydrogenase
MESRKALCGRSIRSVWILVALQLAGCATTLQPSDEAEIAGSTYVVTGASSGFGRGVALELGALGANVVLAARRTDLLEAVAGEIRAAGGSALAVTTDVSSAEEVRALAEAAIGEFGQIDVWINNAGVTAIGRFWDIPLEDHARVTEVNFHGILHGSYVAMQHFRAQGHGTLVNLGSVQSRLPLANQATYAATKAAVLSLGRALSEELRLSGEADIEVVTVLPWAADTPIWYHAANYSGHAAQMAPMEDPREVVEAIIWVSVHPHRELPVGWRARATRIGHRIFPSLSERVAANIYESQINDAPPAPPTTGALYEPMTGTGAVDGGVQERMEREKEQ